LSDGQHRQIDAFLADQFHIAKQAGITRQISFFPSA
jgi:hypothetical protein